MEAFKQPILPDNPEQLKERLKYVDSALSYWKKENNSECGRDKDLCEKNIDYFQLQKNNIEKKLK